MRKKIENHIKENIKEYLIFALILIIGIFIGTMVLNNSNEMQRQEISGYLNDFTSQIKEGSRVSYSNMLFEIIKNDVKLVFLITFLSVSIVGVPALYIIIGYKGFSLGYTIAAISATFGTGKGLLFSISLMLFNKIIEIPAIFYLALNGIKMFKAIIKDRSKENIKYAVVKYAGNLIIAIIMLLISAFLETYLSTNLFINILKYL